jgi:hypothetical protein
VNILETELWTVGLPPEWWADQEEEHILIGDRDDVGSIEFSTLVREDGEFGAEEVSAIARDNAESPVQWTPVRHGEFSGVSCAWRAEGDAVREWYVAAGSVMLFITYSCADDNAGMDDAAVDEILDTLQTRPD